jgi:aspartate/methionine/tyrosine aminotransferase
MKLEPFALERWFARYEFAVEHMLSGSDCESLSVAELLDLAPGAREELLSLRLGYTEAPGHPALRERIAGLYRNIAPEQVLVFCGAEEAIYTFFQVLLEPGDQVIVQWPCYQSLRSVPASLGAEAAPWRMDPEQGWALDPEELPRLAGPRAKALVLNSPHNPTGGVVSDAARDAALGLARERGLRILSDEVYRGLEYGGEYAQGMAPALCDLDRRAVSIGVMSKTYGLPGLRIGWAACRDREFLGRMAAHKDYTTICCPAPSELLARVGLLAGARLAGRSLGLIRSNLALAEEFFARRADRFQWLAPQAGPIAFPRLAHGQDAEPLCVAAAEQGGVLLLPGRVFGPEYAAHFRLGLGRASFPQALDALGRFLETRQGR